MLVEVQEKKIGITVYTDTFHFNLSTWTTALLFSAYSIMFFAKTKIGNYTLSLKKQKKKNIGYIIIISMVYLLYYSDGRKICRARTDSLRCIITITMMIIIASVKVCRRRITKKNRTLGVRRRGQVTTRI